MNGIAVVIWKPLSKHTAGHKS